MIPRELLKKIRQIELRTNRIVTETLAGFSFQPSPQFRRIPRAVPDGNNYKFRRFGFDGEIDGVRPVQNFCLSSQAAVKMKSFGILTNSFENVANVAGKFLTKAGFAFVIKVNGF